MELLECVIVWQLVFPRVGDLRHLDTKVEAAMPVLTYSQESCTFTSTTFYQSCRASSDLSGEVNWGNLCKFSTIKILKNKKWEDTTECEFQEVCVMGAILETDCHVTNKMGISNTFAIVPSLWGHLSHYRDKYWPPWFPWSLDQGEFRFRSQWKLKYSLWSEPVLYIKAAWWNTKGIQEGFCLAKYQSHCLVNRF